MTEYQDHLTIYIVRTFDEIFGKKDKTLHEELMEGFEEEKKQREEDE